MIEATGPRGGFPPVAIVLPASFGLAALFVLVTSSCRIAAHTVPALHPAAREYRRTPSLRGSARSPQAREIHSQAAEI